MRRRVDLHSAFRTAEGVNANAMSHGFLLKCQVLKRLGRRRLTLMKGLR
jgi:hypothetical protein